jgi:hypothetical protein
MTSGDQYAAVAEFLARYYAPEPDEMLANIAALDALRPDYERRLALAMAMRDLLRDAQFAPEIQRFVLDHAVRADLTAAEAREFLKRVFESNQFHLLLDDEGDR